MNILNIQLRSKTVGILILVLSILVLISTIVISIILLSFGLASGIHPLALIPFVLLVIFLVLTSSLFIYIGIRYIKDQGFKKNENLGKVLIIFSLVYLSYTLVTYMLSNLTDNSGGQLQPIIAFIFSLITIPFGLVLKNGTKN